MKKLRIALFTLAGMIVVFSLPGCKKILDEIKHHPNGKGDNCRVENIYFSAYYSNANLDPFLFKDTANFKYNVNNQLVSVDFASTKYHYYIGPYPIADRYFKYDNSGRLQVYLESYFQFDNVTHALFWHKYTYINATQIIDSVFNYTSGNPAGSITPETGDLTRIGKITLDSYGRVIKDEYAWANSTDAPDITVYSYDGAGNLVSPGVTYTSKTSIFQTNKTMMFVARDYSVNTRVGEATQYNSNQLPVKFVPRGLRAFVTNEQFSISNDEEMIVEYKCK
ncbi:MAG: hypothetical protein QM668_09810 [Agriterribacter sp.]